MRVSKEYYDEVFDFRGEWDIPSSCGLKIRRRGDSVVVIVTELYQDNPGTSVTYAGRSLAEQICAAKGLKMSEITYIECNPDTKSKLSFYDEEYFAVDFSGEEPKYKNMDADEIKKIV